MATLTDEINVKAKKFLQNRIRCLWENLLVYIKMENLIFILSFKIL